MAFFGNKKPSKDSKNSQDAKPDMSDFSSSNQDIKFPEFPSYEDTTSDLDFESIKEEVTEPPRAEDFTQKESFGIPQREKKAPNPQIIAQQAMPDVPKEAPQQGFSPGREYDSQDYSQSLGYSQGDVVASRGAYTSQKPLYVKIEDYKDAVYTIDKIKAKLKEADVVLEELSRIRKQEDTQLEDWKHDIENIKSKLLDIDKILFGE